MGTRLAVGAAISALLAGAAWAASPADALPKPKPEKCLLFDPDLAEDGMAEAAGLDLEQVRTALNGVIQHALECPRPEGAKEAHLTFELLVGCDGVVSKIEASDTGGMPADYVACVSAVIAKADFPAHDMANGMPITYPVNVTW